MIEVLGRRNSANVQKVMWAIGELGLEYTRHDVGGSFGYPDDYPNPNQVVPTIKDGDLTVWESGACVRYLAREYGQRSLWPDDRNTLAIADQWMEWHRSDFSNAYFPTFMNLVRVGRSAADLADSIEKCAAAYQQLETQLAGQDFIAGNTLTMGDIPTGTVTYRYFEMTIDRPSLPNVEAWYQRLCDRPAFRYHVMIPFGTNPEEWAAEEQKNADIQ